MRATALVLGAVLAATACGDDSRTVAGDYRLRRGHSRTDTARADTARADASYSLWNTARPEDEAGWSGAVLRIGWDVQKIVVLRAPPSSPYGAAAGWMVIDVKSGTRSPILTEAQLRQRADVTRLPIYRADSA